MLASDGNKEESKFDEGREVCLDRKFIKFNMGANCFQPTMIWIIFPTKLCFVSSNSDKKF